mgnify:CR=1 FL=1
MYLHRLTLLLAIGTFMLTPSLIEWWFRADGNWTRPFLIWAVLLLLTFILEYKRKHHDI